MKFLFYLLASICAALVGWNFSLLVLDLINATVNLITQGEGYLKADFIFLPIMASCFSVALIFTEIYISNPINYKANRRVRTAYLKTAFWAGISTGLVAAIITFILYKLSASAAVVRVISWGIIGLGIGLAEGLCWLVLSDEGAKSSAKSRFWKSTLFGLAAGLIAAVIVELIRKGIKLGGYEDLLGFVILGICLVVALTFSTAPTYQVALRAGRGFGIIDREKNPNNHKVRPKLQNSLLTIVYRPYEREIEEGLSIQLPKTIREPLLIGSAETADIFLPGTPAETAKLILEKGQWKVSCLYDRKVRIQGKYLLEGGTSTPLYHNQVLNFYYRENNEKYYCCIFCDRFYDSRT